MVRIQADSVQEGKAIPHRNTDRCTEFASSSCFATNDRTNMWLNQVDDSVRDPACMEIQQEALLEVQLTDHKKFRPPVRAQARKACTRDDQSINCIKIPLQRLELVAHCDCYLAAAGLLLLGNTKGLERALPRSYRGRCVRRSDLCLQRSSMICSVHSLASFNNFRSVG
jgi:hypothetical protein